MDASNIISPLNNAQRDAVTAPVQPLLVLAGAGSGKTRVLVHRIAWLIMTEKASPFGILAVTFTNKAAAEMKGRIETLLDQPSKGMWIGTFHSLAHRLLRRHYEQAKLPQTFQVIDSDDQYRIIKRILKSLNLDEARWPPRQAQWYINGQKDEGIRARYLPESADPHQQQLQKIFKTYEELCERSGLVDFAELLLRAHELLRDNADVLWHYRERFKHVLVDEFQDTNTIQYAWLRLLAGEQNHLFVVGDDDQSIYGWRGAKIENIFSFQTDYTNHKVVRLEQNYRSTGNILKAANSLISNNSGRLGKDLWTEGPSGESITLYAAFNEQDEAYFVIEQIRKWVNEGQSRKDIAILYRSNAQSRQFEEKLMATAVPYRVYGGLRFFERSEIKNALAYLRLLSNPNDDPSFERIINIPTRGIGAKTLDDIRLQAQADNISMWQAAQKLGSKSGGRTQNALSNFTRLIFQLAENTKETELYEQVKLVIEQSGLIAFHQKEKGDKGEARVENLEELVNAARSFEYEEDNENELNELDLFLAHASLEAGDAQGDAHEDCVQLMTLHSAKGLEFPKVFLVGFEEGLFPSQQSREDPERLEEERRLCYVGMTRAMETLYMTYAESRRLYGKENYASPSRFIREIPDELLQEVRLKGNVTKPYSNPGKHFSNTIKQSFTYKLGQRVKHQKFGEGVVLQMEGSGAQERLEIHFEQIGSKWLMVNYAKLEMI